jgi:hypothetical protein
MSNQDERQRHIGRWGTLGDAVQFVGQAWRSRRAVGPLAFILALTLAFAALSGGAYAHNARTTPTGPAPHQLIESADVHVDDLPSNPDFELDVSITQTQNNCGASSSASSSGAVCLRYGIAQSDQFIQAGYGLIPARELKITGAMITLTTDTSREPGFIRTYGSGGPITLTWMVGRGLPRPQLRSSALSLPTVQGSVIGYRIPATNVTAGVLIYGGS